MQSREGHTKKGGWFRNSSSIGLGVTDVRSRKSNNSSPLEFRALPDSLFNSDPAIFHLTAISFQPNRPTGG